VTSSWLPRGSEGAILSGFSWSEKARAGQIDISMGLAFIVIVVSGLAMAEVGASVAVRVRERSAGGRNADSDVIFETVIAPVLGLFALVMAFTLGSALQLNDARGNARDEQREVVRQLQSLQVLVPAHLREGYQTTTDAYAAAADRYAATASDSDAAHTTVALANLRAFVVAVDGAGAVRGADQLMDTLKALSKADRDLVVAARGRIPVTVLSMQSVYYLVSFFLVGYIMAVRDHYAPYRWGVAGTVLLFAMVLMIVINLGRPGLRGLLLDPLT